MSFRTVLPAFRIVNDRWHSSPAMTTRLTFVCHASTSALRAAVFPLDEPLDAAGKAKGAATVGTLPRADRAWTSPERRTTQTAEVLQVAAIVEPALRDCDYGRWSGLRFADLQAREPDAVVAWMTKPGLAPHGGESVLDLMQRVGRWLDERSREKGHGIVVTHPAVIRAAIIVAIGAAASSFWRVDVVPLSRTELRGNSGRWTLRSAGCTAAMK
jgi:broad specificity phosphatase PhoE